MKPIDIKNFTPMPKKLEGWGGDAPVFKELINSCNPSIIIEVGTWLGQSACTMAHASNPTTQIICVDTWLGAEEMLFHPGIDLNLKFGFPNFYYQFLSNIIHEGVQDKIIPFPNTSKIAAHYMLHNNIKADMIYIDASHEYSDVLEDLKLYYNLRRNEKSVFFGHDYLSSPDVRKAVDEFAQLHNRKVRESHGFWIFI